MKQKLEEKSRAQAESDIMLIHGLGETLNEQDCTCCFPSMKLTMLPEFGSLMDGSSRFAICLESQDVYECVEERMIPRLLFYDGAEIKTIVGEEQVSNSVFAEIH